MEGEIPTLTWNLKTNMQPHSLKKVIALQIKIVRKMNAKMQTSQDLGTFQRWLLQNGQVYVNRENFYGISSHLKKSSQ